MVVEAYQSGYWPAIVLYFLNLSAPEVLSEASNWARTRTEDSWILVPCRVNCVLVVNFHPEKFPFSMIPDEPTLHPNQRIWKELTVRHSWGLFIIPIPVVSWRSPQALLSRPWWSDVSSRWTPIKKKRESCSTDWLHAALVKLCSVCLHMINNPFVRTVTVLQLVSPSRGPRWATLLKVVTQRKLHFFSSLHWNLSTLPGAAPLRPVLSSRLLPREGGRVFEVAHSQTNEKFNGHMKMDSASCLLVQHGY